MISAGTQIVVFLRRLLTGVVQVWTEAVVQKTELIVSRFRERVAVNGTPHSDVLWTARC